MYALGCVGALVRVCMRVGAWVRYSHLANISKMAQDATRAGAQEHSRRIGGTQAPTRNTSTTASPGAGATTEQKNTSTGATTTSTRAGAHAHPAHAYRKRNYKNNSK